VGRQNLAVPKLPRFTRVLRARNTLAGFNNIPLPISDGVVSDTPARFGPAMNVVPVYFDSVEYKRWYTHIPANDV
jgi:hypothetical protein